MALFFNQCLTPYFPHPKSYQVLRIWLLRLSEESCIDRASSGSRGRVIDAATALGAFARALSLFQALESKIYSPVVGREAIRGTFLGR